MTVAGFPFAQTIMAPTLAAVQQENSMEQEQPMIHAQVGMTLVETFPYLQTHIGW